LIHRRKRFGRDMERYRLSNGQRLGYFDEFEQHELSPEALAALTNPYSIARGVQANPDEFRQTLSVWLSTNRTPRLSGDREHSIWGRVVPLFFVKEPAGTDRHFVDSIVEQEGPGVLAWAVRGLQQFTNETLVLPEDVSTDLQVVMHEAAPLNAFIESTLSRDDNGMMSANQLWAAYKDWCRMRDTDPEALREFSRSLRQLGFPRVRRSSGNYYRGLTCRNMNTIPTVASPPIPEDNFDSESE
jgi:putative DNA primase/helicase